MPNPNQPALSELYSAYAAGVLAPAFALMVETQGMLRPDVRRAVAISESLAGTMLEAETGTSLRPGAVDRALAAIDRLDAPDGHGQAAAMAAGEGVNELLALPEPLRTRAIEAAGRSGWKMLGPGIRRLALDTGGDLETELYRISPGAMVPRHTHAGSEYTLVVSGGFTDETGSFGPGDLVVNGPDDTHRPVGDEGEPCFALTVRDGGLRFTGMMGVIQRMLGA